MDLNLRRCSSSRRHSRRTCGPPRPAADHLAKVINVASIDGIRPNPLETYSYHASKAGVIHLTKRLASRLAPDGVIVSGIAPEPSGRR